MPLILLYLKVTIHLSQSFSEASSVVEELAAREIISTSPIFTKIFNTLVLQGIEAYRNHVLNFSQTWKNAVVTIHDEIADKNRAALLWSFIANRVSSNQSSRWGGITLLRIDNSGKVVVEIGEESEPGPQERLFAPDVSE